MSLINNKFIVSEGLTNQRVYNLDDLTSFKYEYDKYGSDTVELQAFSKSLNKYVPLTWYDYSNAIEKPDLRNNLLIKNIAKAKGSFF